MLRAGGKAELTGSITIACSGGDPAQSTLTTFEVSLNTNFGGRITETVGAWTEALLSIDDPSSPVLGVNVIQGQLIAPDRIRFTGVLLSHPGAGSTRRIRISNLRVEAPDNTTSTVLNPTQVVAFVSASSIPISTPQLVVGFVQTGLRFQVLNGAGSPAPSMTFGTAGSAAYRVRFWEGFSGAFRKRNVATSVATPAATAPQAVFGNDYGTETGVYIPALGATNGADQAGLATQGTRLMATFTGIPAGVTISVAAAPRTDSSASATARLVQADADGAGAYLAVTPGLDGRASLPVTGGTARAVWEVLESDAAVLENLQFDVVATYSGTVSGSAAAAGAFAPGASSAGLPIPRFGAAPAGPSSGCSADCLLTPSAISFQYRVGDALPAAIPVTIASTGAPLAFRVVAVSGSDALGIAPPDGDWLLFTPATGTTPATVSVSVAPGGLLPGVYSAILNVTSGRYSENIFVVLHVSANSGASVIPFGCVMNAGVPPIVRATGLAEQLGELVFNCSSEAPASSVIRTDIRLSLNTTITTRVGGAGSEILLLVNEPGGSTPLQLGVNAFRGEMQGTSTVIFRDVPVPAAASLTTVLRVVNLRGDASRIGVSGTIVANQVIATARASRIGISGPTQTVGFTGSGYSFRLLDAGLSAISGIPVSGAGTQGATLEFREGFSNAFRRRNAGTTFATPNQLLPQDVPGGIYLTETGFFAPAVAGLETGGLATQGTRLMARLTHVPAGVRVYVTVTETGSGSGSEKARLVHTDHNGGGPYTAVPALSGALFGGGQPAAAEVAIQNGAGMAVWEVTGNLSLFSLDTLRFGLLVVADGTGNGTIGAEGVLAPLSQSATADGQSPLPRFSTAAPGGALCSTCIKAPASISLSIGAPSASIPLTAESNPVLFTAAAMGAAWLRLDKGAGSTPATITVTADGTGLSPGTYTASVVVNSTTIPVTFSVYGPTTPEPGGAGAFSLSVDRLEMSFAQGAASAAQTVRLDGTAGLAFQATSNTPWLLVSPASGTAPATLTVSANTGAAAPGEYLAQVTVVAFGVGAQVLPVRVSVTEAPRFLPLPAAVTIPHALGSAPAPVVLYVTAKGRQTKYTAEARSAGGWLSVSPESGMTPVNLRLTYRPENLPAGTYAGSILLTSTDGAGPPLSVPVTLEIR